MAASPYRVSATRIGNSSGLRLPARFYRDHPQFEGASGQVEVLSETTLLLHLEPAPLAEEEPQEESLILGLFLDFLTRQALSDEAGPMPYTEAMAQDDDDLLDGVNLAADDIETQ
jgi:antitoxin PrlF